MQKCSICEESRAKRSKSLEVDLIGRIAVEFAYMPRKSREGMERPGRRCTAPRVERDMDHRRVCCL